MENIETLDKLEAGEVIGEAEAQNHHDEKLFTQEQVNEIVKRRLAKVKHDVQAEQMEGFEAKAAELTARESRLSCREYLMEQGYPMELLDTLDTLDVEKFKEKADAVYRVFQTKTRSVLPLASSEMYVTLDDTPIEQAFAYGKKHTPKDARY